MESLDKDSPVNYRIAVLSPAWGVLCEILKERKAQKIEKLIACEEKDIPTVRSKIVEIDEIMGILDHLLLEQRIIDTG